MEKQNVEMAPGRVGAPCEAAPAMSHTYSYPLDLVSGSYPLDLVSGVFATHQGEPPAQNETWRWP
jgi:hypothetical protein